MDRNKLWEILKEMRIPDHLTCLLRNQCADQEKQLESNMKQQTGFKLLSPCLFNFYAEYIMWNAGLDETQAGMKIARRNINNLRYANDATLMTESKEELKSLLMKMKEESDKLGSNSTFKN